MPAVSALCNTSTRLGKLMNVNLYFNFKLSKRIGVFVYYIRGMNVLYWMEDRETLGMHKYGESRNDSHYESNCTSRHFRSGTYEISGRLTFVGQSVRTFQ